MYPAGTAGDRSLPWCLPHCVSKRFPSRIWDLLMSDQLKVCPFPTLAEEREAREHYLNANANVKRKPYVYELGIIVGCEEGQVEHALLANRLNGFLLVGLPELCLVRSRRWEKLVRFVSAFKRSVRQELVLPLSAYFLVCDEADPKSIYQVSRNLECVSAVVSTYRQVRSGEFRIWKDTDRPVNIVREHVAALHRGAVSAGIDTEAEDNFERFSRLPGFHATRE